jgi:hypothetical protein
MLVLAHFLYSDYQSRSQGLKPMKHSVVVLKRVLPLYVSVAKFLLHNWLVWQPIGNPVATNAQIALTCPRRVPTMYILIGKMSPNTLHEMGLVKGNH